MIAQKPSLDSRKPCLLLNSRRIIQDHFARWGLVGSQHPVIAVIETISTRIAWSALFFYLIHECRNHVLYYIIRQGEQILESIPLARIGTMRLYSKRHPLLM